MMSTARSGHNPISSGQPSQGLAGFVARTAVANWSVSAFAPPSTGRAIQVLNEASGDAKKNTAAALAVLVPAALFALSVHPLVHP